MADPKAKIVITAEDQASAVFSRVSGAATRLATMASGAFAALAVPAAVYASFKSLVGSLDDLADTAQGVGVTAVQLSQMRRAAAEAGVGAEVLDGALSKLNVKITEAAKGSTDAVALFRALGVAVTDSAGNARGTSEVLGDLAGVFASIGDGPAKTALAVDLFGKAGAKLVPYLNAGADALQRFNGLTQETVDQATKLQAEFDRSAANADKLKYSIAGRLLPTVNDAVEAFRKLQEEAAKQDFGEMVKGALSGGNNRRLVELFKQVQNQATQAAEAVKLLEGGGADDAQSRRVQAGQRNAQAIAQQAEAIKKQIEAEKKAAEEAKAFTEQIKQQVTQFQLGEFGVLRQKAAQLGLTAALKESIDYLEQAKGLREAETARIKEQAKVEEDSRKAVRDIQFTTDEDIANIEAETAAIGLNQRARDQAAQARQIQRQAEQAANKEGIDGAARAQIAEIAKSAQARASAALAVKATREAGQSLQDYVSDLEFETSQLGRNADERQRAVLLRDLEKRGIDAQSAGYDGLLASVQRATEAFRLNREEQDKFDMAQDAGRILADGFWEAATAGKSLRSVIGGIINDLARMVFQRQVTAQSGDWLARLLNLGSAASGSGTVGAGGLYGGGDGATFGGYRATGGEIKPGQWAIVGERGPEPVYAGRAGATVLPNSSLGGRGMSVGAINVSVPAGTSRASAAQVGREIVRQLSVARARFA